MRINNKRQRLILNHRKKLQSHPFQQLNLPLLTHQMPLKIKNASIIRIQKSCGQKENIIRSRSIPSSKKLNKLTPNSQSTSNSSRENKIQRIVFSICQKTAAYFKQNSHSLKQREENRGFQNLECILLEVARKIMAEKQIYTSSSRELQANMQKLKIQTVFQIPIKFIKQRNLSINSALSTAQSNQIKQFLCQSQKRQQNSKLQQKLTILSNQCILNKHKEQMKLLDGRIDQLKLMISQKETHLNKLKQEIDDGEDYISQIQRRIKEINIFIDKMPNKQLQLQTQEYKQSEQELYDFAFLFDQAPLDTYIQSIPNHIAVPYSDFKRTLKSLAECRHQNKIYTLSQQQLKHIKSNLDDSYEYTIDKVKQFIKNKISRIEGFIETMKKLASLTISKRQYLTEINKKMAITSVNIDKLLDRLAISTYIKSTPQLHECLNNLTKHFKSFMAIYCEAEIFY